MFKWVHMSDIHFTGYSTFNDAQIKEKLIPYLKELGHVDALFLTGDFRYAKDFKGNVDDVVAYINQIATALNVTSDNIVCVPGNHDLDRGDLRTAAIEATVAKYDKEIGEFSGEILQQFNRGFSFFDQIEEKLGHAATVATQENIHYVKHLQQVDTLLGGRGRDGIKYYWKKNGDRVESVAFNKRLCEPDPAHEAEDLNISAYTLSTSFGCVLSASNQQCRFCETGSRTFKGFLSAEEIAMQSIFMACYDADCPSFPEVRTHKREFAFMGQGEPGLNYSAVREAIRLTDCAMEALNQEVHRYVISSCGIDTFIPALIADINSNIFKNKVSLHFSLHGIGKTRTDLMPIGKEYDYREFISSCEKFYNAMKNKYGTADKIGVGLLMFKNFVPTVRAGEVVPSSTTLAPEQLSEILKELDPQIFRIDLSDFNNTSVTENAGEMSNEEAHDLLTCAQSLGFEAKIFSSFGRDRHSGCGMLKSEYLDVAEDGSKTIEKYHTALDLLHYSIQEVRK